MKSIHTSQGEFIALNLMCAVFAFALCLCLCENIRAGNVLLSCNQESSVIQGEIEQKIQFDDKKGEINKIGFNDEQGNKRYFYQYSKSRRPDRLLGSPLYFYLTNEGIVLKEIDYIFPFSISVFLSLMFSVSFGSLLIKAFTHRIECEVSSKKNQHILNLLKWMMFIISITSVIFASNRVHTDFFLQEGKAHVISVKDTGYGFCYHVKAFSLSTRTEIKADWNCSIDSYHSLSPATGQEVNVCYPPNSKPVFARKPSSKVTSVVLLGIALAYMSFTTLILLKGRVQYNGGISTYS